MGSYEDEYDVDYAGEDEQRELPEVWHVLGDGDVGKVIRWLHDRDEDDMLAQISERHPGTGQTLLMWAVINKRFVFAEWMVQRFGRAAAAYPNSTHVAVIDRLLEELRSRSSAQNDLSSDIQDDPYARSPNSDATAPVPVPAQRGAGGDARVLLGPDGVPIPQKVGEGSDPKAKNLSNADTADDADVGGRASEGKTEGGAGAGAQFSSLNFDLDSAVRAIDAAMGGDVEPHEIRRVVCVGAHNGAVGEGGLKCGPGVALYPNGDMYVGGYDNDIREGVGLYLWAGSTAASNNTAAGGGGGVEGSDGADGPPKPRSAVYVGEWRAGVRSGRGRMLYADGSRYFGEWVGGKREGQGRWTGPNGDVYEGSYVNDRRDGRGALTFARDRSHYVGRWRCGEFVCGRWVIQSSQSTYVGAFSGGAPRGPGVFVFGGGGARDARAAVMACGVASSGGVAVLGVDGSSGGGATVRRQVAGGGSYYEVGEWVNGRWKGRGVHNATRGAAAAELRGAVGRHSDVRITFARTGGSGAGYVGVSATDAAAEMQAVNAARAAATAAAGGPCGGRGVGGEDGDDGAVADTAGKGSSKGGERRERRTVARRAAFTHGTVQELSLVAVWPRLTAMLDALPSNVRVDGVEVLSGEYISGDMSGLGSAVVKLDCVDENTGLVVPMEPVTVKERECVFVVEVMVGGVRYTARVKQVTFSAKGGKESAFALPTSHDSDGYPFVRSAAMAAVEQTLGVVLSRRTVVRVGPTPAVPGDGDGAAVAAGASGTSESDPLAAAVAADGSRVRVYSYRWDVCADWFNTKQQELQKYEAAGGVELAVDAEDGNDAGGAKEKFVVQFIKTSDLMNEKDAASTAAGGASVTAQAAVAVMFAEQHGTLPKTVIAPMRPSTPPPPPRQPAPIYSDAELLLQEKSSQSQLREGVGAPDDEFEEE